MRKSTEKTRDAILLRLLPEVPFDGWTLTAARKASIEAGFQAEMADAVFPKGAEDLVSHFADWADRQMLAKLKKEKTDTMRVQDKIRLAVRTRIEVLVPHKEAERAALSFWARPLRKFKGVKTLWRTANRIWVWAGDTSTDYNHYTKRSLLSGVIASTMMAWMAEDSDDLGEVLAFLDRRIDNVMMVGQMIGKFRKKA